MTYRLRRVTRLKVPLALLARRVQLKALEVLLGPRAKLVLLVVLRLDLVEGRLKLLELVKLVPLQGKARLLGLGLGLRSERAKLLELRPLKLVPVLVLVQRAKSLVRRVLPPRVLPEAR